MAFAIKVAAIRTMQNIGYASLSNRAENILRSKLEGISYDSHKDAKEAISNACSELRYPVEVAFAIVMR